MTEQTILRAPFPWFGGKSRVAGLVWDRFGEAKNYVEPFAGSLAVLLGRPHPPRVETVNDRDYYLANFWRSLAGDNADPEKVAHYADAPVNEADLHARHLWLVHEASKILKRVPEDPEFFDAKIAGWWVWGQCLWIGSSGFELRTGGIYEYMFALAERLRRVRVCCGDWKRVVTPSITTKIAPTALFLDPPYHAPGTERSAVYNHDDDAIWFEVRDWAVAHGNDPLFRIALCGYEAEDNHGIPSDWECVAWKAAGGYGRSERGLNNRGRERIWFSPHCLTVEQTQFEMGVEG
jgi:hypothetical protein